jgi:hypothetical protein
MRNKRKGLALGSFVNPLGLKPTTNSKNSKGSVFMVKMDIQKLNELMPLVKTSLFLFTKENKLREKCWNLITNSRIYEYIQLINIIISLTILAIDSPLLQDSTIIKLIYILDILTNAIFFLDIMLKIISFGVLFNGEYSYLRYPFNIVDLVSFILSLIYISANGSIVFSPVIIKRKSSSSFFKYIKIMRIVRVSKLINRSKSLQAALSALYASLKQMLNIIFIGSLCILMFSIIFMTYFRGLFFRCDYISVPDLYMQEIFDKWDCLDYGGEWVNPYPNFDNIKSSFILLFEMMTTEGWTNYMFSVVDARGLNLQPITQSSPGWSIIFIVYMIFAYFFLLNLSIAILSDNFKKEKTQIENQHFKIPIQKEFFKIYQHLYRVRVPKKRAKSDKFTKFLLNILDSIYFDVVITVCIISNMITLMMNWAGKDKRTNDFIDNMNTIFNYIFIGEAVLKIFVYRQQYFRNGWNIMDFVIVVTSTIQLLLASTITSITKVFDSSVLRALRVGRILRLLKKAQSLNRIFNLFINSIPGVINIAILWFLTLFVYSIIGMSLFGYVKFQNIIGPRWNFQNFESSLMILVRTTAGEGWNDIMHECSRERSTSYFCKYSDEMTDDELFRI